MDLRSRAILGVRHLLHKVGVDLVRSLGDDDLLRRRLQLLRSKDVNVVFDVGAHAGQYGQILRSLGYTGRLVSFEPLPGPFSLLSSAAARDEHWVAVNTALGEHEGEVVMHVAGNSQSSSMLDMLPRHAEADPRSAFVDECRVKMTTLSQAIAGHTEQGDRLFVKVDAQGYEEQVLAGGRDSLGDVAGFQLELSLVPLYEGQAVLHEVIAQLSDAGFVLMSIEPGFWDQRTGQLLQADGIFLRD